MVKPCKESLWLANKKKAKKRLGKVLNKRSKEIDNERLNNNWRNIFVKSGYLIERGINHDW